jgi:hypothetical protein
MTDDQEVQFLYGMLGFCVVMHGHFVYHLIHEITTYLKISCFSITKSKSK